ncbi:MAG: hypothetical protein ACE14V_00310 [bacterium]
MSNEITHQLIRDLSFDITFFSILIWSGIFRIKLYLKSRLNGYLLSGIGFMVIAPYPLLQTFQVLDNLYYYIAWLVGLSLFIFGAVLLSTKENGGYKFIQEHMTYNGWYHKVDIAKQDLQGYPPTKTRIEGIQNGILLFLIPLGILMLQGVSYYIYKDWALALIPYLIYFTLIPVIYLIFTNRYLKT